jgi:hypothetical protein
MTESSKERLAISEMEILTRIFGTVYGNDSEQIVRHNEELYINCYTGLI